MTQLTRLSTCPPHLSPADFKDRLLTLAASIHQGGLVRQLNNTYACMFADPLILRFITTVIYDPTLPHPDLLAATKQMEAFHTELTL